MGVPGELCHVAVPWVNHVCLLMRNKAFFFAHSNQEDATCNNLSKNFVVKIFTCLCSSILSNQAINLAVLFYKMFSC